jgi:hypothetical protein
MPFDPSNDDDAWWNNPGPLRLTIHPAAQSNPPSNVPLVPGANYNNWARRNGPAGGADLPNDWFVPQPSAPSACGGDSLPDDWFVPQPSALLSAAQAPPGPQSSALNPVAPNPPATPRDLFEPYWSLIPASRVGAFAWHPPIFLNSDGRFPPPAPTYDPPVLPAYRLFGGIEKMPAVFAAANARPIGGGGGLFDSLAGLSAGNTDAPPSIFSAIARPPYAAPMPGSNPSLSPSYPPHLGGSALPSYLAGPPPPDPTLFAWLPQLPGPTAAGDSPLGSWNGVPAASSQGPATAAPPTRSVLFNDAPAAWDPGAPDRNAANLDQTARTLGLSDLPISKSGATVVSPPPQLSITPQQGLDIAHLVSPNLVDYFTKSLPPAPPLSSTPGKIPSADNPYALGAAFEAATWLLAPLERGIVGPLEGVESAVERRVTGTALDPPKGAIAVPASTQATEQIVTGPYGKLSGTLPPGFQANHLNQNGVYGDFIPKNEGLSVAMRGDIIAEPGTPHHNYHRSLEQFWEQYRDGSSLEFKMPTNAEYGEAVKQALIASGLSPAQALDLAEQAAAQRVAYGLSESAAVPRIPRAIWPRRRS